MAQKLKQNGLTEFIAVLADIRRVAIYGAGGLIFLPFLASFGGYSPPWPRGIVGITSLVELIILVAVFQVFYSVSRARATRFILMSLLMVSIFSLVYMTLNAVFVYEIPSSTTKVVLGCGLSDKSKEILLTQHFANFNASGDTCPGEFFSLLSSAQFETEVVWNRFSVSLIKVFLSASWLCAFASLAALVGCFVTFQKKRKVN